MNEEMTEWIALAKVHMERIKCEKKCLVLLLESGADISGLNILPNLDESIVNVGNCISMIHQYAKKQ